jgi:hypothetical protein
MVNSWNANTIHEHCKQHAAILGLVGELAKFLSPEEFSILNSLVRDSYEAALV